MDTFTKRLFTWGIAFPALFASLAMNAQNTVQELRTEQDTLKERVVTLRDRVSGIEERIATAEGDLSKLTKIKLSGYIQAQYLHNEAASSYPDHLFQVRRARLKVQYEPVTGVAFVLQPDFVPGNITLKDAYVQLNDRWLKMFSITAGKFNRPSYEVEYSSSSREVPERSRLIRAIYPDERAIGAKLEIAPLELPLKFQFAVFNGNDGISINNPVYNYGTGKWDNVSSVGQNTDFDRYKDLMARLTWSFKLGRWGGLTVGTHGYYGMIKANTTDVLKSDYAYDKRLDNVGKGVPKRWAGFEAQFYADVLGGLALKGEYIFGVNSTPGYYSTASYTTTGSSFNKTNDTLTLSSLKTSMVYSSPAISRNFSGYYIYLVKNIGVRHQLAVRYDYYNPNTKLSADTIGRAGWNEGVADQVTRDEKTYAGSGPVILTRKTEKTTVTNKRTSDLTDIPYGTWTLGYSYYFDENIKIMLAYEIPMNTKVGVKDASGNGNVTQEYTVNNVKAKYDFSDRINQNVLTLRLQVKF